MRGHLGAALPYFPDQLYYISFELIKNAMRAVTEFHADKSVLPPVTVRARIRSFCCGFH
jgi:hypothetical protein